MRLSHIFNRIACIYVTFRSSFRISLIDDLAQKMSQTQSLIIYLLYKLVCVREKMKARA